MCQNTSWGTEPLRLKMIKRATFMSSVAHVTETHQQSLWLPGKWETWRIHHHYKPMHLDENQWNYGSIFFLQTHFDCLFLSATSVVWLLLHGNEKKPKWKGTAVVLLFLCPTDIKYPKMQTSDFKSQVRRLFSGPSQLLVCCCRLRSWNQNRFGLSCPSTRQPTIYFISQNIVSLWNPLKKKTQLPHQSKHMARNVYP